MATRYYCDGCDQEINNKVYVVAIMTIPEAADALKGIHAEKDKILNSPQFHLCDDCVTRLKSNADPRQWPRLAQSA